MSNVAEKVRAIIVDKLGIDYNEIKDESSFIGDFSADSLDNVELIMEFEKEFNVAIPDTEMEGIKTVGEAIAVIKMKLEQKTTA